jgi:hypothetical protein
MSGAESREILLFTASLMYAVYVEKYCHGERSMSRFRRDLAFLNLFEYERLVQWK